MVTVADGGHGVMGDQWHGRGHGGVQEAEAIVTRFLEQQEVVKHSGRGHSFVIVSTAGRRRARRLLVEHGQMGMSGSLLMRR